METAKPRLSEVAALAGVSEKTVSNVINDYTHVSDATRHKVKTALKELNYRVNPSARSLAGGRTGFIALVLPTLANPYFAELADHVIAAAARHGWTVLIEQTGDSQLSPPQSAGGTLPNLVDGVVLLPESLVNAARRNFQEDVPTVVIGEKPLDEVAAIAGRALTEHLISCGRNRIAAIGMDPGSSLATHRQRFQGYRDALDAAGIQFREDYVLPVANTGRADGWTAAERLLSLPDRPDSVICFNDLLAIGAISHFAGAGVLVPSDIAIAGFDNIAESAYTVPPLTTISWETAKVAEWAVSTLVDRHAGNETVARSISLGYELIIRNSTTGS